MPPFSGGKSGSKSTRPALTAAIELNYGPSPGNAGRKSIYVPSLWLQQIRSWLDDPSAELIENSTVSAGGGD
jgi:hypothetical protein